MLLVGVVVVEDLDRGVAWGRDVLSLGVPVYEFCD